MRKSKCSKSRQENLGASWQASCSPLLEQFASSEWFQKEYKNQYFRLWVFDHHFSYTHWSVWTGENLAVQLSLSTVWVFFPVFVTACNDGQKCFIHCLLFPCFSGAATACSGKPPEGWESTGGAKSLNPANSYCQGCNFLLLTVK